MLVRQESTITMFLRHQVDTCVDGAFQDGSMAKRVPSHGGKHRQS